MIYPVNPPPKGMTWFNTWVKKRILVKPYIVWTGDVYIVCSKTGARLLKKAYRYIIKAFRSGFSWGGQINSCHFLVSTDGYCRFEISIPPFHSRDKTHLFRDFNALNIGLLKHFKHNSVSALYINHLSYFTTNPPNRVWAEPLYFERYLDFLGYQFAFAGPNARAVLTDWLATASSLMGRLDKQDFDRILWRAWYMLQINPSLRDWVSVASRNPIYHAIMQFKTPTGPCQYVPTPQSLYGFSRCTDVHGAEKTLTELFPPEDVKAPERYVGQDAWAALEAQRLQRKHQAILAAQAAMASQQGSEAQGQQAPSVEHQPQQAPGVEHQPQQAPGVQHQPQQAPGVQQQPQRARTLLMGNYIQTMINPVELSLMLGHDFGNFIAQATALIIIELDMGLFHA
ncbi:hypothetical protein ACQ4PT_067198 [Festuca glaucescens]